MNPGVLGRVSLFIQIVPYQLCYLIECASVLLLGNIRDISLYKNPSLLKCICYTVTSGVSVDSLIIRTDGLLRYHDAFQGVLLWLGTWLTWFRRQNPGHPLSLGVLMDFACKYGY